MPNPVVHAPRGSCKRGKLEWVVKGRFCKSGELKSIPLRGPSNLLFQASMNNSHEQRPTLYAMPSSSRFPQMRSVKWIAKAGFCKGGGLKSLPLCSLSNLLPACREMHGFPDSSSSKFPRTRYRLKWIAKGQGWFLQKRRAQVDATAWSIQLACFFNCKA